VSNQWCNAIILGLALQSTLADAFLGVALNLSRAYKVGDWIVLSDSTEGRVIETNCRGTSLLNGDRQCRLHMLISTEIRRTARELAHAQYTELARFGMKA
jgi:small-conductance mechanosensitive channel